MFSLMNNKWYPQQKYKCSGLNFLIIQVTTHVAKMSLVSVNTCLLLALQEQLRRHFRIYDAFLCVYDISNFFNFPIFELSIFFKIRCLFYNILLLNNV